MLLQIVEGTFCSQPIGGRMKFVWKQGAEAERNNLMVIRGVGGKDIHWEHSGVVMSVVVF